MPIPTPRKGQDEEKFMQDCMGDPLMNKDYKDQKQRAAICYHQFSTRKKNKSRTSASSDEIKWSDIGNNGAIGLI
jgi:hypothetical protein